MWKRCQGCFTETESGMFYGNGVTLYTLFGTVLVSRLCRKPHKTANPCVKDDQAQYPYPRTRIPVKHHFSRKPVKHQSILEQLLMR